MTIKLKNLSKSVTNKDNEVHIKNLHTKKPRNDGFTDEAYEIYRKTTHSMRSVSP